VFYNSAKLILLYFSKLTPSADYAKIAQSLDYLRHLNTCALQARPVLPRAFSAFEMDKRPSSDYFVPFRFGLLAYYCAPQHFELFRSLIMNLSKLNERGYSVLNMMTSVTEIAWYIVKTYKQLRNITKVKERLAMFCPPEVDVEQNYMTIVAILVDMGKVFYDHVAGLIHSEANPAIFSVSQAKSTATVLRKVIVLAGVWDSEPMHDEKKLLVGMQMSARLAFGTFTSATKRQDLLNWAVGWYGHQLQIDFTKDTTQYPEPDAVGYQGI